MSVEEVSPTGEYAVHEGKEDLPQSWVSGSDVSTWSYCGRLFWMTRLKQHEPDIQSAERFTRGHAAHAEHGKLTMRQELVHQRTRQGMWFAMLLSLITWGIAQWSQEYVFAPPVDFGLAFVAIVLLSVLGGLVYGRLTSRITMVPVDASVREEDTVTKHQRPLRSQVQLIYGRPDYILEEEYLGRMMQVPVELKPTKKSERLYEADELQLLLYLLLLSDLSPGKVAPFGRVIYGSRTFIVERTLEREARLHEVMSGVRESRATGREVARTHNIRGRCRGCAVRKQCSQSLWVDPPIIAVEPSKPSLPMLPPVS